MFEAYNIERLPLAALTIYAELTAQLVALRRSVRGELPPGSFVTKEVRGRTYWYIQYSEAGSRRQVYVGPDEEAVRERLEGLREAWSERAADAARTTELVAMLRAAGVHGLDGATSRVLEVLGDQGIFDVGSVLVGSLAFGAYEGMLGVKWGSGYRTADIDVAAPLSLAVAVPARASLEAALATTGLPFDAIPALDPRQPSTSFKLRRRELRVDVLTPEVGEPVEGPIFVPALKVAAQPLRFLDYLIDGAAPAAVPCGAGVLASVPDPARFALHKLIVSGRRNVAMQVKALKDVAQASQVLAVLLQDRAGDLTLAWAALRERGKGWVAAARKGAAKLPDSLREQLLKELPEVV